MCNIMKTIFGSIFTKFFNIETITENKIATLQQAKEQYIYIYIYIYISFWLLYMYVFLYYVSLVWKFMIVKDVPLKIILLFFLYSYWCTLSSTYIREYKLQTSYLLLIIVFTKGIKAQQHRLKKCVICKQFYVKINLSLSYSMRVSCPTN